MHDLVLCAAITSVSSSPNPKAVGRPNLFTVATLHADTKSAGRCFVQVMAQSAIDKISLGPRLDALTAEKVFGWKNVHQYDTGAGTAPRVDIKCGVADGDSFGFEPKLVCS